MRPVLPFAATALSLALIALAGLLFVGAGNAQSTTNIEVDNFYFCDSSHQGNVCDTTVNVGDTVTWNVQTGPHTITQCDDTFTTCPPSGGFNSGTKNSGESFSQTFDTAGIFAYRCNLHPTLMQGRITVAAAQATGTTTASPVASASPTATSASSPTLAAATGTPSASRTAAAVPTTGGDPGGGNGWASVLVLAGGILLITAVGVAFRVLRRQTA